TKVAVGAGRSRKDSFRSLWAELTLRLIRQLEIRDEELARVVVGASAGPHEPFAVGGEDREGVGTGEVGDADGGAEVKGFALNLIVSQPQVVVGAGVGIGVVSARPDDELARGMPIGAPVDALGVGELRFIFAVDADDENLQPLGLVAVAAE